MLFRSPRSEPVTHEREGEAIRAFRAVRIFRDLPDLGHSGISRSVIFMVRSDDLPLAFEGDILTDEAGDAWYVKSVDRRTDLNEVHLLVEVSGD
ncbi:hypothetical protein AQ1_01143 [alpha proteobacterium Q-1]|nr:hypothetical protein AQ1_01143 [alpha proteobacterium Q-1]